MVEQAGRTSPALSVQRSFRIAATVRRQAAQAVSLDAARADGAERHDRTATRTILGRVGVRVRLRFGRRLARGAERRVGKDLQPFGRDGLAATGAAAGHPPSVVTPVIDRFFDRQSRVAAGRALKPVRGLSEQFDDHRLVRLFRPPHHTHPLQPAQHFRRAAVRSERTSRAPRAFTLGHNYLPEARRRRKNQCRGRRRDAAATKAVAVAAVTPRPLPPSSLWR